MNVMRRYIPMTLIAVLFLAAVTKGVWAQGAPSFQLSPTQQLATAGYFTIEVESLAKSPSPKNTYLEVVAEHTSVATLRAPVRAQSALTISGLANGHYRVQLVDEQGILSNVVAVEVKHHSFSLVWPLFALGFGLFVALLIVIVRGYRGDMTSGE